MQTGRAAHVIARLSSTKNAAPVTPDDLQEAHTKKLHLLIIDSSLSDYHHIHPVAGKNPGEYIFDFKPLKKGPYHVWADITPRATNRQEYARADLIASGDKSPAIVDKTPRNIAQIKDYTFTLRLDGPPVAGQAVMGSIRIAKAGKPFTQLEPVMGAFAHVVGFSEDGRSVLHIHPMGAEPETDAARGGPVLRFHIEPETPGFIKLFAQVRIEGQDLFAPFGLYVGT